MQCPVDGETLVMADRNGVEIDYCPKCRGVWLDRGELDKIVERATAVPTRGLEDTRRQEDDRRRDYRADEPRDRRDDRRDRYDDDDDDYRRRPKRRESFLSDLFDF